MRQYNITPAAGKRLIGKALASHPEIQKALDHGTVVIVAGTTNNYVAEKYLNYWLGRQGGLYPKARSGLLFPFGHHN